jgi:cytochrome c oxidase subunit I
MRYGNGLAPGLMGLLIFYSILYSSPYSSLHSDPGPQASPAAFAPIRAALYASLLLFASGGLLALLISGINTIIPAHYHGSIVGITLAFMGVVYLLLPQLGYSAAEGRIATTQPYIYAVGQLMHITGLALSGSEGAQRKTAGVSVESMNSLSEQLGLFLTRSGGLIAVIGGLLFLVVCWRAMRTTVDRG